MATAAVKIQLVDVMAKEKMSGGRKSHCDGNNFQDSTKCRETDAIDVAQIRHDASPRHTERRWDFQCVPRPVPERMSVKSVCFQITKLGKILSA